MQRCWRTAILVTVQPRESGLAAVVHNDSATEWSGDLLLERRDFDGTVLWDGAVVPDRAQLEQKLMNVAAQADQPEVHLRPNKLVAYKSVAGVMASAQRLGVTKIGMVGNEQFQ